MASVKFQARGRGGRVPLSLYAPIRVTDEKPLFKVLPNDAVPQGFSGVNKDQQIGYWNEQVRWRMRRGERVELPSNWHFYYLGTGPHADVSYRKRTPGVVWVAHGGSKASPTGLPTRKPSEKPIEPTFKSNLPSNVEIVEPTTPQASRQNSRSRSRGPQSRDQSASRNDSQNKNNKSQSRNNSSNRNNGNQSRNQSRSRDPSNDRGYSKDDLLDAVRETLKSMGIGQNQPQKKQNQKGSKTPKNKSRSNSKERVDQAEKPEWRRVPVDGVEACFGQRGGFRNFGDSDMVAKGVYASGYPQVASLAPNTSALLFGGNVSVRPLADETEITYTYKMTVSNEDPNLALFLQQVDAYKNGTPKEQRVKKQERSRSPAPPPPADVQTEAVDNVSGHIYENVDIINEVYDDVSNVSSA
nr:MAG: N protein [Bat coronavirus]